MTTRTYRTARECSVCGAEIPAGQPARSARESHGFGQANDEWHDFCSAVCAARWRGVSVEVEETTQARLPRWGAGRMVAVTTREREALAALEADQETEEEETETRERIRV